MNELLFSSEGWRDYLYWQTQDRKTLKRINALLASIQRDGPENGLGKPEALRHRPGWSLRINENIILWKAEISALPLFAVTMMIKRHNKAGKRVSARFSVRGV